MKRKVVCEDFFSRGDHNLYEDDLGFPESRYREAMTTSDKEVLRYYLMERHDDLWFFSTLDNRWYFILNWMTNNIVLMRLRIHPRYNPDENYVENSLSNELYNSDDYAKHAEVLYEVADGNVLVDIAEINGVPLHEVVKKSWLPVI